MESKRLLSEFRPPEMELSDPGYFSEENKDLASIILLNALEARELTAATAEPIVLGFIDVELNRALAQIIQQQWEKTLGITVKLQALESKVFYQKLREKDFQMVLVLG